MSLFLQAIMLSGWAMVSQLTHSDKHNDELKSNQSIEHYFES
jgi:hypothetical protein